MYTVVAIPVSNPTHGHNPDPSPDPAHPAPITDPMRIWKLEVSLYF